jgi:transposase
MSLIEKLTPEQEALIPVYWEKWRAIALSTERIDKVPNLWSGAVVVMDNLSAHKLDSIVPMIEAVGAKVICLSSYSPDFNPIELWWSQLKSFLRSFAPTTTEMVDKLISVALDLINPQHLRNWFANCS